LETDGFVLVGESWAAHLTIDSEGPLERLRRAVEYARSRGFTVDELGVDAAGGDRDRHLHDAAALLACIQDPFTEAEDLGGSDRSRIRTLTQRLPEDHPAWLTLCRPARANAQAALRILSTA